MIRDFNRHSVLLVPVLLLLGSLAAGLHGQRAVVLDDPLPAARGSDLGQQLLSVVLPEGGEQPLKVLAGAQAGETGAATAAEALAREPELDSATQGTRPRGGSVQAPLPRPAASRDWSRLLPGSLR